MAPITRTTIGDSHHEAVARVLGWMATRLPDPVDLDQMAAIALMSPYHFLRTFRATTGVPPKQFLGALRIEAAKRLLLATDRSVLEVCFDVGYGSLGTFTRRFTQLVGLAPGRFRQLATAFYPDLASLLEVASSCPLPAGGTRVRSDVVRLRPEQVVFAGLFDTPVPQGRPLSCAVLLPQDDSFEVATTVRGQLHLFAVAMDADADPIDLLVGGRAVRAVATAGPLPFDGRHELPLQRLELAPARIFDPPILLALPLLLHERVAAMGLDDPLAASPASEPVRSAVG